MVRANFHKVFICIIFLFAISISCKSDNDKYLESYAINAERNPEPSLMLKGYWVPDDPHKIDFEHLPKIKSQHSVVSDVRKSKGVNQHNYLIHHNGKFWLMWSDGPGVEDMVGQRVAFATSEDGLKWSKPKFMTPYPPNSDPESKHYNSRSDNGFRYISRGFWKRGDELLALVSIDEGNNFFGASLELRAFRLDSEYESWEDIGLVYDNAINNFPPKLLPNKEWMMTRRTFDRNVFMLTGGVDSFDHWQSHPVVSYSESELIAEEPYWWVLPDNNLVALFRDNARSGYLFRSFSNDNGRTWTKPLRTDFPDARSKFNGLQLKDGRYLLVSNPNPKKRDPLALSISDDGVIFSKMGYLFGGRRIDYPHIIEHSGYILVAFSGAKQSVEVLKIKISELDKLKMPPIPLIDESRNFIIQTEIALEIDVENKEFRYTTDGSIPTNKSPLYKKPVRISETTQFNIIEFYSNGKKSPVASITYKKLKPLKPVLKSNVLKGLKFEYFEFTQPIKTVDKLLKMKPVFNGINDKLSYPFENKKLPEQFGLIYEGFIKISKDGVYTFSINSNDGSTLTIADQIVVDNDGVHSAQEEEGEIALKAGMHRLRLRYFQSGGAKVLQVFIKDKGTEKVEIGSEMLCH